MVEAEGHLYADSSALVKLIVEEPESAALRQFLAHGSRLISSRIATVEVRRVASRQQERDTNERIQMLFQGILLIEFDAEIAVVAGAAPPVSLRSLDAIHLATAQSAAPEIAAVITYDRRLADAARVAGLTVVAPG